MQLTCPALIPLLAVVLLWPAAVCSAADTDLGPRADSQMTVQIVLVPSNEAGMDALLSGMYDPDSPNYQQWLGTGEFYARFAPSPTQAAAVRQYFEAQGLLTTASASPFFLRVSGPSQQIAAAFGTSLHNYRNVKGVPYFANATPVHLPAEVASGVRGVVGLSDTVRLHSHFFRPANVTAESSSCEAPYPSVAQLINAVVNGVSFPFGYAGGPGCTGLTPSQINSIYGAPRAGARGQGAGVTLAVFELSAYQHSDIVHWAQYFYGPDYEPDLIDIDVDGGPLAPVCPSADSCPPDQNGYAGDAEVAGDIEAQLSASPDATRILVYNAPNDSTGQTELDEYSRIASDNRADVLSVTWGSCESDAGAAYAQAEDLIFRQMALQGQSVFVAAGDSGAFGCTAGGNTPGPDVGDPTAQPWVTSVGGTSLETFNPGIAPKPAYPQGIESVWNPDGLCNTSPSEGGIPGSTWCALTGAGGGGSSQFWGRPFYQRGPGVTNRFTTYADSTAHCVLAAAGTPCREVPDVSADADGFTPFAAYCTGSAALPNSTCAQLGAGGTPPGWFANAGTSIAAPLWSAIIANRIGYWHHRIGNANPLLYFLYVLDPDRYFHDITGTGQTTKSNGLFPTTVGYDLATGIGTPKMAPLITDFAFF